MALWNKKYTPELCDKMRDYFYNLKKGEALETEYFPNGEIKRERNGPPVYPTFEMFARSIGVDNSTFYLWEKEYPEFKEAMDAGRNAQKAYLLQNGLGKVCDANMAKYVLGCRWRDEYGEVQKVTGEFGLDIRVNYGKPKQDELPEHDEELLEHDEGVTE